MTIETEEIEDARKNVAKTPEKITFYDKNTATYS